MRTEDTIDTEVEDEKDVQSKIRKTVTKSKKKPKKEKDGEGTVNNNIEINPTMDDAATILVCGQKVRMIQLSLVMVE